MTNKTLLCIVGPTAIGKTALSIAFAKAYNTAIISSDSRQFYKEMTIGTAVPEKEELDAATHYFIQDRSIFDDYSVGDFERDVIQLLPKLFTQNDVVVMVGGSALYEKAVTYGLDDLPDVPHEIQQEIKAEFENKGISWLQEEVQKNDAEYFETVDIHNSHRLIRAIGIFRVSGKKMNELRTGKAQKRNFNIVKIGLTAEREELYERINKRVDIMIDRGLEQEARELFPHKNLNALQTVGYKEFFDYFENSYDYDEAVRLIKRNTRRFAKRQLTWYRKDESVKWFHYKTRHTEIVQRVSKKLMD
ncbi:tRNA dimethylallyltransferase [Nonlabens dokdonensis]|jgi:tRNA dimethylallyltransferase|uniref:tRNA dimethylallyltransferase n=2 Tax=Nonlabens dokdonensis TaxID=328515 RepID=L7WEK6_NONDD|nr:tRNA (adenosine(37)-N6)-dimethylallyltransferase MiaA [Nonlabens dokdonensis]AGC78712.1 tRNA delta(2)-isopentenylpyrophosphate transferase [Nonlabens dokdonensis DSW-6]PZX39161.1 tRNA dimethylallyltransferase [Nonlabens dokdonensis]